MSQKLDQTRITAAIGILRRIAQRDGSEDTMVLNDDEMAFMRPRIEQRAHICRHKLTITKLDEPDHWSVAMTSSGRTKGRTPSQARLAIEDIKPGSFAAFSIEDGHKPESIRALTQSVRRNLGYSFSISTDFNERTIMVTRIDSLEQASPALRADVQARMAPKYPISSMGVGDQITMPLMGTEIENLRSMASYEKRKRGKAFSIKKTVDGYFITRTA